MASPLDPSNAFLQAASEPVVGLPPFEVAGNVVRGVPVPFNAAQPSLNLLGVNIPGVPLISFRDYFLTQMESWVTALPLRTQWVLFFDTFPAGINSSLIQSLEPTDGNKLNFNVSKAKNILTSYPLQGVVGCIFAQGISIPTENLIADSANLDNNRGFIKGTILRDRDSFAANPLTVEFRETNTSFVDLVLRPWLMLASHAGYVARKKTDPKYCKANITIIQYTRSYQKLSQVPRKIWQFYNCVPLNIAVRNLTYDTEAMEKYDVSFAYDSYGVQDNLYLPVPDLIKRFTSGQIPRISPFQR
jgi:hypothetical protein